MNTDSIMAVVNFIGALRRSCPQTKENAIKVASLQDEIRTVLPVIKEKLQYFLLHDKPESVRYYQKTLNILESVL